MNKLLLLVTAALLLSAPVFAEDIVTVPKAEVTKITMAGGSATVTLTDLASKQVITVTVSDEFTLNKFKKNIIVVGDEIRLRYDRADKKKTSKSFRKTAGCSG